MQKSANKLWDSAREVLRQMLNAETFKLWFSNISAEEIDGETITLGVIDEFNGHWLKDNYLGLIRDVLAKESGQIWKVDFIVNSALADSAPVIEEKPVLPAAPKPATNGSGNRKNATVDSVFNPSNTFESFVVGDSNTFAHGAALAVAQSPGRSYNPLFLYGGVGLGKTHLLHAIAHHVLANNKSAKVS